VTAALDARNLSKVFNGQAALAAADLTLEPGEIRALAGANGSGKSTLVKILAGVYDPEPGASLEVAGERVGFGPRDSEARVPVHGQGSDLVVKGDGRGPGGP